MERMMKVQDVLLKAMAKKLGTDKEDKKTKKSHMYFHDTQTQQHICTHTYAPA